MAKLVFLGRLEDLAGMEEIVTSLTHAVPLLAILEKLPPELVAALRSPKIRVALNGAIVPAEQVLDELTVGDSDEIAFLPPVSGG